MGRKVLILFFFNFFIGLGDIASQDFNVPFIYDGNQDQPKVRMLRDSSLITIVVTNHLSQTTNIYDSAEYLIVRYNKRGDVLYYSKLISLDKRFHLFPTDILILQDKIFISGFIDYIDTNVQNGFLMRLNECLEVEKSSKFQSKSHTNYSKFNILQKFSETSFLGSARDMIETDTIFTTLFLIDMDLNLLWNSTYMGDNGEIAVTDKNIHIWGAGYYPMSSDHSVLERKLNHVILDLNGKVLSQKVENEHKDFNVSAGGLIVNSNSGFLIGCVNTKPPLTYFVGVRKIDCDGNLIKQVQLNDTNNEEAPTALSRINDNRFLITSIKEVDLTHEVCMVYLIDSNLNLIRKKVILGNFDMVTMLGSLGFNDGVLLSGSFLNPNDSLFQGVLYKIDTSLTVIKRPSLVGYTDSLCLSPSSGKILTFDPDTVWLESLALRKNVYSRVGIAKIKSIEFTLFPNPSEGKFTVSMYEPASGKLSICDFLGQIIYTSTFESSDTLEFDPNIPPGMYFVRIQTEFMNAVKTLLVK